MYTNIFKITRKCIEKRKTKNIIKKTLQENNYLPAIFVGKIWSHNFEFIPVQIIANEQNVRCCRESGILERCMMQKHRGKTHNNKYIFLHIHDTYTYSQCLLHVTLRIRSVIFLCQMSFHAARKVCVCICETATFLCDVLYHYCIVWNRCAFVLLLLSYLCINTLLKGQMRETASHTEAK